MSNQGSVFRSRDLSGPITGQYYLHVGQERDAGCGEDQRHDAKADKLLAEHDPGQQVDEGGVGGEQGGDHGAVQHLERLDVQVVGEDGHQTEHHTSQQ